MVELLEALKNIFDIPNCVFVLAIDYDVVVKGLESKFGVKTEKNEREFRSFFDKIIQVPFSMPVGTYSIENFLLEKLREMRYEISSQDAEDYAKVVRMTVGTNPRSLKRYLNSYSLINQVKQVDEEHESSDSSLILFALLGIQISFPYVFRMLTKQPDYLSWDSALTSKEDINFDAMKEKIKAYGESEYLDETWEQVLWSLCQRDAYLRSRAFDALALLNFLRDKYGESLGDELEAALEFAAITSVDDDSSGKQATIKVGNKTLYSGLEPKLHQMEEAGLSKAGIEAFRVLMVIPFEQTQLDSKFRMSFAKTGSAFYNDSRPPRERQMLYVCNPGKKKPGVKFWLKGNSGIVDEIEEHLCGLLGIDSIEQTDSISMDKRDLILEVGLCDELGQEKYLELLKLISTRVCENQDRL